jgi:DNA-directed RNA polymerase specialized sigma24 family protein
MGSVGIRRREIESARRTAGGDADEFARFFEAWFPHVHGWMLRRAPTRELAQTLTERALRRALRNLERYDGSLPLGAWVFAFAHRTWREQLRGPDRSATPSASVAAS